MKFLQLLGTAFYTQPKIYSSMPRTEYSVWLQLIALRNIRFKKYVSCFYLKYTKKKKKSYQYFIIVKILIIKYT